MAPIRPIAAFTMLVLPMLMTTTTAAHIERYGELPDVRLFADPPGLGPRYFLDGMPPVPALPAPLDGKRQDQTPGQCGNGNHSCLDLGPAGAALCCRNDQYCFLDAQWAPKCCGLGTTCGSPCPENLIFCNDTVTSTLASSPPASTSTDATPTANVVTSQVPACCGRACPSTSQFLCQAAFGGQCCAYGAQCISGGSCFFPSTTPTSGMTTLVTPVPPGCTTSQIACDGGGCCNLGRVCTSVAGAPTPLQCAPNLTVVDSGALSEGARAGIGVGVSLGAALVIGGLTWFWMRRRREARSRRGGGEGESTLARSGADALTEPYMPHTGAMSDLTSPSSGTGPRPRLHQNGLGYEYVGPVAIDGPYTDRDSTPGLSQGTDPRTSPEYLDRTAMGVHRYPEDPSDIRPPVELDTRGEGRAELGMGEKDMSTSETTPPASVNDEEERHQQRQREGPYELYSPPPMTAEEAEHFRTRGIAVSPSPPPIQQGSNPRDDHDGHK